MSHKDLSFEDFSLYPLDTARARVYNGGMWKAAIIGTLALIFLPAIKVALLCAVTVLNYIPTLF